MRLIFLGAPGVGKGTYASRISKELGIAHISTGDLLREEVKNETQLGKKAKVYMEKGELVPDELVNKILKERLKKKDCEKGFILDGYPRTIEQAKELEKITKIDLVLNITLKKEILIKKISARRICKNCGKIYNIADINEDGIRMPPILPKKEGICDDCGGELYQRPDDDPKVIEERLKVYEKQTKPLIDYYKKKGLLKEVKVTGGPELMVPKIIEMIKGE
ncbi:MAG: adenylate kinase [Candidatus Aenigmatarchaeota archaeon]